MGSWPVKKGRHRRFEEARALKRSPDIDFDRLLDDLKKDDDEDGAELELDDEYDEDDDDVDDDEDVRRR
jgi:hypothetical protein